VSVILNFDGACLDNGAPDAVGSWAWVLYVDGMEHSHDTGMVTGDTITSNVAEYEALLAALRWLLEADYTDVEMRGDSQLVIRQVGGAWNCNAPHLRILCDQAVRLLAQLRGRGCVVTLAWIRREYNTRCDQLAMQRLVCEVCGIGDPMAQGGLKWQS